MGDDAVVQELGLASLPVPVPCPTLHFTLSHVSLPDPYIGLALQCWHTHPLAPARFCSSVLQHVAAWLQAWSRWLQWLAVATEGAGPVAGSGTRQVAARPLCNFEGDSRNAGFWSLRALASVL